MPAGAAEMPSGPNAKLRCAGGVSQIQYGFMDVNRSSERSSEGLSALPGISPSLVALPCPPMPCHALISVCMPSHPSGDRVAKTGKSRPFSSESRRFYSPPPPADHVSVLFRRPAHFSLPVRRSLPVGTMCPLSFWMSGQQVGSLA